MVKDKVNKRNPWLFIPTQYFAEGIPWVIVNQLSTAMYKSLEVSNLFIGFTSFLYLPWSIKLFWGPYIDSIATKRKWVIWMQLALAICFAVVALTLNLTGFILISLILFTVIAFLSATHDIATDGFYLHSLDKKEQAFFTGIRSTFYRVAMVFAGGVLLSVAGWLGKEYGNIKIGWTVAFVITALVFLLLYFYHNYILPYPETDLPVRDKTDSVPYKQIFKDYFSQEKIGIILAFILLYRFGEALLLKMAQPFFLDKPSEGGLGLGLSEVGIYYGTVGIISLLAGGILGGWLIKKYGLKKLIWYLALSMNIPTVLFVYMAAAKPLYLISIDFSWILGANSVLQFHPIIQLCIIIEQLGYGLGFTAYMVYLLYISKGKFKTSHYAISTGVMAFGMMLPGFISGVVQELVGYFWFFAISVLMTIPGMLTLLFLPLDNNID
ncbi:MAG: MFS transporter [Ignavibacteriae bacterium]|nr:MFS transporter [Ignavibacteriota bacterium]